MKSIFLSCGLAIAAMAGWFTVTTPQGAITGTVSPADGAETIWAASATDTAKGIISAGSFSLAVKPGLYKLFVDAKDPYRDVILDVDVRANQPTDVGEIVLKK